MLYLPSPRVIYCIGGGPSLQGFDFTKLNGYKIGANKSAFVANADMVVSMDGNWARQSRENLEQFDGIIVLGFLRPEEERRKIEKAHYVTSARTSGVTHKTDRITGYESGHCCLDMAFKMKPEFVGLLGYDMKMGKTKHFHGGYPWDNGKGNYKSWAPKYGNAMLAFEKEGIEVINYVGPEGSNITAFPTRPLGELQ